MSNPDKITNPNYTNLNWSDFDLPEEQDEENRNSAPEQGDNQTSESASNPKGNDSTPEPTPIRNNGENNPQKLETERGQELKHNKKVKKAALALTLTAVTSMAILAFVGSSYVKSAGNRNNKQNSLWPNPNTEATTLPEQKPYQGETSNEREFEEFEGFLPNGVYYNYTDYYEVNAIKDSERLEMKSGKYGKDVSFIYNMPESTPEQREEKTRTMIEYIVSAATKEPEALASYAPHAFSNEEKAALGIQGMSDMELDAYMSNPNNKYGGELQKSLIAKLKQKLEDPRSRFAYNLEYGREDTYYISHGDNNSDRLITPDETTLCKESDRQRHGDPQVTWYYDNTPLLNLNMKCGLQPCFETGHSNPDVPEIDYDQPGEDEEEEEEGAGGSGGEELEHKNEQAEIEFAGSRVDRRGIEDTPRTEEWEDRANFDLMESVRRQQAEIDAENQRIAEEQAEAERRAAEEAEARRQAEAEQPQTAEDVEQARLADEAAAAAEAEAAERQRQAADEERARQAEEEARRAAEEAANRQAAENEREAAARADDTAEERSHLFESGDF